MLKYIIHLVKCRYYFIMLRVAERRYQYAALEGYSSSLAYEMKIIKHMKYLSYIGKLVNQFNWGSRYLYSVGVDADDALDYNKEVIDVLLNVANNECNLNLKFISTLAEFKSGSGRSLIDIEKSTPYGGKDEFIESSFLESVMGSSIERGTLREPADSKLAKPLFHGFEGYIPHVSWSIRCLISILDLVNILFTIGWPAVVVLTLSGYLKSQGIFGLMTNVEKTVMFSLVNTAMFVTAIVVPFYFVFARRLLMGGLNYIRLYLVFVNIYLLYMLYIY